MIHCTHVYVKTPFELVAFASNGFVLTCIVHIGLVLLMSKVVRGYHVSGKLRAAAVAALAAFLLKVISGIIRTVNVAVQKAQQKE